MFGAMDEVTPVLRPAQHSTVSVTTIREKTMLESRKVPRVDGGGGGVGRPTVSEIAFKQLLCLAVKARPDCKVR